MPGNWQLADGALAEEIERRNLAGLRNATEALVLSCLARKSRMPGEADLRMLHRAATIFLLKRPGAWRSNTVHLARDGVPVFDPPPPRDVPALMRGFFRDLSRQWKTGDALDAAAFALWRIAWIHPFKDGNGRTAFAFAHACLCIKLGALLPGRDTVVDQLLADASDCYPLLRRADKDHARTGKRPDMTALKRYLDDRLLRQMDSARQD